MPGDAGHAHLCVRADVALSAEDRKKTMKRYLIPKSFTERERQVIEALVHGHTTSPAIAQRLDVDVGSARKYLRSIRTKLGIPRGEPIIPHLVCQEVAPPGVERNEIEALWDEFWKNK